MEFGRIVDQLKHKSILITGSTGFLGKIFVEKVLRVQPEVKKLYLLVRAREGEEAMQRVQNEVIGNELFNVLREIHGDEFDSLISVKVHPIAGDLAHESLGINDVHLRKKLWKSIEIIVNIAATTKFYDRYDVALGINVLGAKHVLEFGRKCTNLEMLLHVSTAYVVGIPEGLMLEKLLEYGKTLKAGNKLDIDHELRVVEERKRELYFDTSMDSEQKAMKELGLQRARNFGWPNTYVFTKAMAEMLLCHSRGNLPLVIIRPTIVTSIYKEPIPGWMEGSRTMDNFIEPCAKGKLSYVFGDPATILDVIPGDLVVNAMIVTMTAHSQQQSIFIYHVCSSVRNPMAYSTLVQAFHHYVDKNPGKANDGKAIKSRRVYVFKAASLFWGYLFLRYRLPLEVLHLLNVVFCQLFSHQYKKLNRNYKLSALLFDLYAPYVYCKGCFDDTNLERLRITMEKNSDEATMFNFDPKDIDWIDYFSTIHIPGLLKSACEGDQAK